MLDFSPTSSRTSCMGATQIELEMLYSKYQLMDAMRAYFAELFEEPLEQANFPVAFGIDFLAQMALHKRAAPEVLVGQLKHHFKDETDPCQACAEMIVKAMEEDLADWDADRLQVVVIYGLDKQTQEQIDRYQFPLPMIEKPMAVRTNRDTGYRTIKGSLILKKNHHDEDICLDHIDRMNAQRLRLNGDVVAFCQNSWKNLDKQKDDESYADFRQRKKAFQKYDRSSRDVIDAMLVHDDGFYLTHKYDKRGRTYAQGYHINPQGSDWNKACVEFADAEPLNEE